jgi:hypothetical protein
MQEPNPQRKLKIISALKSRKAMDYSPVIWSGFGIRNLKL